MYLVELRQFPPFATLNPAELVRVAATARSYTYHHGARIFRAGDPCTTVIVVLDGFVRLSRRSSSGVEVNTGIIRAGELAAVAALRGQTAHDHDAEALGRARTVDVPAELLLDLLGRSPRLFAELARSLVVRTDNTYANGLVAAQDLLSTRILYVLRFLTRSELVDGTVEMVHPLAIRLSHSEVARLVGADRVSVTRALRRLEERALIRRERGHVTGVVLESRADTKTSASSARVSVRT